MEVFFMFARIPTRCFITLFPLLHIHTHHNAHNNEIHHLGHVKVHVFMINLLQFFINAFFLPLFISTKSHREKSSSNLFNWNIIRFSIAAGWCECCADATDISFARRKNSESKLKELRWAFLGRKVRKCAKSFRTCRRRFWKSTRTWIWRLYWSKETIESLERWQRGHCENTKYHWVMLWSRISIEYSSKTTLPCTLYTLNKSLKFELCRLFRGRHESKLKRRNNNYGHQCL